MALEHKIDELTATIGELIKALRECGAPAPEKKTRKKKKPEEVKEEPVEPITIEKLDRSEEAYVYSSGATLDDVKKQIIEVAASHGRDVVVAVLQEFGAEKASELKEEDYARVIEVLKEGAKSE
jgi:hypothetical protein